MPVSESNAALTAPHEATVVIAVNSAEFAVPKRTSLPSRFAPAEAGGVLSGRAGRLGGVDDHDRHDEHREHRAEQGPALAAVADIAPEDRGQGGRDQQDQQHLEEVRDAAGVLERHRAVDVEEPAAVGPEHLDDLLRGHRAERERLVADLRVGRQVLDHALGDEHQRRDERDRQQHVQQRAREVLPEVAERRAGAGHEAADDRDRDRDADPGRDEVLHGQPGHLREVRHRRLAAVVLPVGVGDERGGGVEGHVPGGRVEALGVEGMDPLGAQDQVERQPEQRAEDERRARVGLPVLAHRRVDAAAAGT